MRIALALKFNGMSEALFESGPNFDTACFFSEGKIRICGGRKLRPLFLKPKIVASRGMWSTLTILDPIVDTFRWLDYNCYEFRYLMEISGSKFGDLGLQKSGLMAQQLMTGQIMALALTCCSNMIRHNLPLVSPSQSCQLLDLTLIHISDWPLTLSWKFVVPWLTDSKIGFDPNRKYGSTKKTCCLGIRSSSGNFDLDQSLSSLWVGVNLIPPFVFDDRGFSPQIISSFKLTCWQSFEVQTSCDDQW